MNFIRKVAAYALSTGVGIVAAYIVSRLMGLLWRPVKDPVFYLLCGGWIWIAWQYAKARDKGIFPNRTLPTPPAFASLTMAANKPMVTNGPLHRR